MQLARVETLHHLLEAQGGGGRERQTRPSGSRQRETLKDARRFKTRGRSQELKCFFLLSCPRDPEHSTPATGPSPRVRQCGTARVNAVCSPCQRSPAWVPRAPHICHCLSCQTHCFQAPRPPAHPQGPGLGPRVFPTHQPFFPTVYLEACVEIKGDCTALHNG